MITPNEKLSEQLFSVYAIPLFEDEVPTIYTPSSREEFFSGYDAQYTGYDGCREIFLQFKRPKLVNEHVFQIGLNIRQHQLLRSLGTSAAFYIISLFRTVAELNMKHLAKIGASQFLSYYVAIDASSLADNTRKIRLSREVRGWTPYNLCFQTDSSNDWFQIEDNHWYTANRLLLEFADAEKKIGKDVRLTSSKQQGSREQLLLSVPLKEHSSEDWYKVFSNPVHYPTHFRLPYQHKE